MDEKTPEIVKAVNHLTPGELKTLRERERVQREKEKAETRRLLATDGGVYRRMSY
jgi:hypothetical protein